MVAAELWLVRHGESAGNVAAAHAETAGEPTLAVEFRDADVPLTEAGLAQAEALGRWLADRAAPPPAIWASPFLRARETARVAKERAGLSTPLQLDERLRDRELGILDRLSSHGVRERHPDEAVRRQWQGRFWYRPPGGESWADVVLRLRSVLPGILDGEGPVLIVAHDVVVSLVVYVCCGMTEAEILELTGSHVVGNASVTTLIRESSGWRLAEFAANDHLRRDDAPVIARPEDSHADVL